MPQPVLAFDFFGLFGASEKTPEPNSQTLPYNIDISGIDNRALDRSLNDVSALVRLKKEPPMDGESLVRRATADLPSLTDALWGAGYYNGSVAIFIDNADITRDEGALSQAASRAESFRNTSLVPITIQINTGPQFQLRNISVRDVTTGRPFANDILPSREIRLQDGDPAPTSGILAAEAKIIDYLRGQGYPFARVVGRQPVIDHPHKAVDIVFSINKGPKAGIGTVQVEGSSSVNPAVVRSFIYTEEGEPYSPQAVANIRKTVGNVEALGSVRVREADALDENGNLPLIVDIADRPPHLVGFSAKVSTMDGPGIRGYWANRNLFGGGETLRFDADLFFLSLPKGSPNRNDFDWSKLGGRLGVSFNKPALWGTRNDLLTALTASREATDGYTSRWVNATASIRHRFSDKFSVQAGLEIERGQTSDVLGRQDYTLVGTPVSVNYDTTDSLLDPKRGVRLSASVTPYPSFMGSTANIVVGKAQGSTYYAVDEAARYILAARLGFGTIVGDGISSIPANRRFYAGGGGSVRGYSYRSLSPLGPNGEPIGGKSLIEGSLEARIRVTDTIGVVPFLDFGTAFDQSYPDFGATMRYAAGIGLRYHTAIGPIRADVAFPLNKRSSDKPAVLYISLGQAF